MITATNEDNMALMARYPDNYFDLAIVDPPYGIDVNMNAGRKKTAAAPKRENKKWDNETPTAAYFTELKRVSKNQIIWGGNYFKELECTKAWIFWDKCVAPEASFADGELAWTSYNQALKKVVSPWSGFIGADGKRIHPTQKPVKLYEWLLINYAKEGVKILDTHRGSASLDIACHNLGFDLVTCELDTEYFNDGNKRLAQHQSQIRMF
jgi:site-specific DNA-methyltransferase (adenine-specific)